MIVMICMEQLSGTCYTKGMRKKEISTFTTVMEKHMVKNRRSKVIHTYMSKRKLTKEMADAFVDSIIIHGKYDYEIKLVYDDQFADLQKLKKEKEAQTR